MFVSGLIYYRKGQKSIHSSLCYNVCIPFYSLCDIFHYTLVPANPQETSGNPITEQTITGQYSHVVSSLLPASWQTTGPASIVCYTCSDQCLCVASGQMSVVFDQRAEDNLTSNVIPTWAYGWSISPHKWNMRVVELNIVICWLCAILASFKLVTLLKWLGRNELVVLLHIW